MSQERFNSMYVSIHEPVMAHSEYGRGCLLLQPPLTALCTVLALSLASCRVRRSCR